MNKERPYNYEDFITNMTNYPKTSSSFMDDLRENIKNNITIENIDELSEITKENFNKIKPAYFLPTNRPVSSTPLFVDDYAYFTTWDGYAYSLNTRTRKIAWKKKVYDAPSEVTCESISTIQYCPPYLFSGFVGTGFMVGDLWIIASVGGKIGEPFENGSPGQVFVLNRKNGEIKWNKPVSENRFEGVLGSICVYNDVIYVPVGSLDLSAVIFDRRYKPQGNGKVIAFNLEDGEVLWTTEPYQKPVQLSYNVFGTMCIDKKNEYLYYTAFIIDLYNEWIREDICAVNLKDGSYVLNKPLTLINQSYNNNFLANYYNAGPQVFTIKDNMNQVKQVVGVGSIDGYYTLFNSKTLDIISRQKLTEYNTTAFTANAVLDDNSLFLWCNNTFSGTDPQTHFISVYRLNPTNGSIIWKQTKQSAALYSKGLVINDLFIVADLSGSIYAYDKIKGTLLYKIAVPNTSFASNIVVHNNQLLIGTGIPKELGGSAEKNGLLSLKIK